jgi:N-acetylneuraminic acid mutarotase
MSKTLALALVLVFLTASSIIVVSPVSGATAENTWIEKAPMHQERRALCAASANGKVYAIGGTTETYFSFTDSRDTIGGIVGTNEEYDPLNNTWTTKTPMPNPRVLFAAAVYQNKIYCLGGENEHGYVLTSDVYDPALDRWETKAPMPTGGSGLQANVVNGKIYVIGGSINGTLNQVYDVETNTWSTKTSMPIADAFYVSSVVDNKIYIIDSTQTQIYDTEKDTWNHGATLRHDYTVAVATTGLVAPKRVYAFTDRNVHVYNPQTDTWTSGANVPSERHFFAAALMDDTIYVVGGEVSTSSQFLVGMTTVNSAINEQYLPFGYGSVSPVVSLASPQNQNYSSNEVSLNITLNKAVNWTSYSLDGQQNVTFSGYTNLTNISNGVHNITIYAQDTFGNIGSSETISFTIAKPESESFPVMPVAAVSIVAVALAVAGLLVYHKKHKTQLSQDLVKEV